MKPCHCYQCQHSVLHDSLRGFDELVCHRSTAKVVAFNDSCKFSLAYLSAIPQQQKSDTEYLQDRLQSATGNTLERA